MCGIAGTWGRDDAVAVAAMLDGLGHRGPDASGATSLPDGVGRVGHRRLSIVDLERGDQPLHGDGAVLVANGEIYNAADLRAELGAHRFDTTSDNEVILRLLADGPVQEARRLRGMFAFALVRGDELLLGRDPIGVKPLYVGDLDGAVVFSSELRVLPTGTTRVRPIAPGTVWSSATGSHRLWEVVDPTPVDASFDDHAGSVRSALDLAVRRRLMADVPVGSFLSGGLDSSAIVALMAPHVSELHTFSVGLQGSPDLAAARVVADHLDTLHHEYVLDPDEILEELPRIVVALESYDQDLVRSAVPTWFTARLAAQHVKVVLTGEGADELFAGYDYHKDIDGDAALHDDARRSIAELHHINLQRVDRLTMAHSVEARVPFLDLDLVETALAVPVALRRPGHRGREKALLRTAVQDLLPHEIVWRDKAQFDQGSGTADLLPRLVDRFAGRLDAEAHRGAHPDVVLRSDEECAYHDVLVRHLDDPAPVLANVGRWHLRAA